MNEIELNFSWISEISVMFSKIHRCNFQYTEDLFKKLFLSIKFIWRGYFYLIQSRIDDLQEL